MVKRALFSTVIIIKPWKRHPFLRYCNTWYSLTHCFPSLQCDIGALRVGHSIQEPEVQPPEEGMHQCWKTFWGSSFSNSGQFSVLHWICTPRHCLEKTRGRSLEIFSIILEIIRAWGRSAPKQEANICLK